MIIPEKLLEKWNALRSPNDVEKMTTMLDGSAPHSFSRAFREGKCRDEVFEVMARFYDEKAEMIQQYL